jgi:hypothetical protein
MRWRDLQPGAPVWNTEGCVVGEVVHTQDNAVFIQLAAFRDLTNISGRTLDAPVARLGDVVIRTTRHRIEDT